MRMYDIIAKKRDGKALNREELAFFVKGIVEGTVPDYQAAALLMAIYFNGMNKLETGTLTDLMANSGEIIDLSAIEGIKVDKHSTGGVGDKTTLIIAPIVAACNIKVAKMSGRGLGYTGGTIDKLESIPNFCTNLENQRFFEIVNTIGVAVAGQTGNLAPADKKMYALRDVTATVESIPLIASSIMSKKLASGANAILLDVKTGSGAFMKSMEKSILLAKEMVDIGDHTGRKTVALITDMNIPLGTAIGNSLEVIEAVEVLKGKGPADLKEVSIEIAANMLYLGGKGELEHCRALALAAISDGSAFKTFCKMVVAQGGDVSFIENTEKFPKAKFNVEVIAKNDGYITAMDTKEIGNASVILGAGRAIKESFIDFSAGILIHKKLGEAVSKGEAIATLCSNNKSAITLAQKRVLVAVTIGDVKLEPKPLIYARVTSQGIERF